MFVKTQDIYFYLQPCCTEYIYNVNEHFPWRFMVIPVFPDTIDDKFHPDTTNYHLLVLFYKGHFRES